MLCVSIVYSFLLPWSIPWYGCTSVCSEYFSCFQLFAVTDKAATNNSAQVFVWNKFLFLCHKCPRAWLLGCMESGCSVFKETAKLFYQIVASFYIFINNVWVIQFFHNLTNTWYCSYIFHFCCLVGGWWYVFMVLSLSISGHPIQYWSLLGLLINVRKF